MINNLMRNPSVILQDIIILGAGGDGETFGDGLFPSCVSQTYPVAVIEVLEGRAGRGGRGTRISRNCSSGISVSLAPWCLGITSYVELY